jgi:diguanylate cyclase (GGDEF)-like protein
VAPDDPAGTLHHVALRVANVERSLAFYGGLLGLRELRRFDEAGGVLRSAWLEAGPVVLMLERRLRGSGAETGSGHLLALAIADLSAWEKRLGEAGVAVEDRTEHTLYVRDPDGHRVGLSDFAIAGGTASDTTRLLESERAAREQAQALRAATQALSATLSLQHVLAAILNELKNVVPYDTASVQQLQGDKSVIIGGRGIDLDTFLGFGFDAVTGEVPNRDVLRERRPVIIGDILGPHGYADFPHKEHALSGVRSWMGVPLLFGSQCIGMITLDKHEPDFYTDAHAQAALAFAAQAAIAIENARLYERSQHELLERRRAEEGLRAANRRLHAHLAEIEELQARLREQAIRDPLTGLFNRRYLTETLARELARGEREGRPLSVVLLDVDHFKALNDAFGHEAGDVMLRALGSFLAEQTRHGDIACRYGGEEFVVVLPGASADAALARAEAWRAAFQELRASCQGKELQATVSAGVAAFPAHARTAEDLLRRADAAMYEAKHQGRNRVVLSS